MLMNIAHLLAPRLLHDLPDDYKIVLHSSNAILCGVHVFPGRYYH